MSSSCLNLIDNLSNSIDRINNEVIDNMTDKNMKYEYVCIKPDLTYEFFYAELKKDWEKQLIDFIRKPDKCNSIISTLLPLYDIIKSNKNITNIKDLQNINIDELVFDSVYSVLLHPTTVDFEMSPDAMETFSSLGKILSEHCYCQVLDIFQTLLGKYQKKYLPRLENMDKQQIMNTIKKDYQDFKTFLSGIESKEYKNQLVSNLSNEMTNMYGFSVENELERLIPDELGSLKIFFVKVISTYYNNLHPIIWAQIYKQIVDNVFIELPYTKDEIFRFVSKQILLNSGPFILKILQMIRPVLSPELATKYNLTKLTYPLLKADQVNMILRKVIPDWDMYKVVKNVSASVGNVSIVYRVNKPRDIFVIKIIKPIAVAQSCWEYKTLYGLFPSGSCEQKFLENLLKSNGEEMNVQNEIKNIRKGKELYTAKYSEIFGTTLDANLTTIDVKEGVVDPDSWYCLAMTLAPGVPISQLVENDLLEHDTRYRAKLHRCLDLLVYKFFLNLIQNGFYHGDLHAGNIFFSYEENQMTLIDFGATGQINLLEDTPDVRGLFEIIIMSIFYDYDNILDRMTDMLNDKCKESEGNIIINKNSNDYTKFKEELTKIKINNIINHKREKEISKQYKDDLFSQKRIDEEEKQVLPEKEPKIPITSIYSYLEVPERKSETIVENRDELPVFTEKIGDQESITFSKILEMIIKFYASHGVNIAIKFNEFYELQKAYALLLGVLSKVGYNSYRIGIAMRKSIVNWENIPKLLDVGLVKDTISIYWEESKKFEEIEKNIKQDQMGKITSLRQIKGGEPEFISSDKNYYKYIKYKKRYMNLKNKMNKNN